MVRKIDQFSVNCIFPLTVVVRPVTELLARILSLRPPPSSSCLPLSSETNIHHILLIRHNPGHWQTMLVSRVLTIITITLLAALHFTGGSGLNYDSRLDRGYDLEEKGVNIPWTPNFNTRPAKRFFWSKPTKDSKNRYLIKYLGNFCCNFFPRRYGMWITAINKEPAIRVWSICT